MKRNLLDDLDSSDEEDNTIPIEFVNKIIFDYLTEVKKKKKKFKKKKNKLKKIGYENTGNCLLKESPIENSKSNSIQNIIQKFSSRVKVC